MEQKEELIKFADKINWYPEFMKIRYEHWVKNLNWDWNISRQRFYGVPFPVWYSNKTGEIILPEIEDLPIDPTRDKPKKILENHKDEDIIPEMDVMDTWATSSMTPQINYHWRLKTEKKEMIPMDLRPQGHDIIRTWAFYTITKAYYHDKNIPWKDIVISGHGQDSQGKKMSKSKGNVVWIEDVIKKYSSDALRYWSAGSGLGDDCPYQEKDVLTGQKLVNKIFNAGKFVMLLLEKEFDPEKKTELTHFDKWILSELDKLIIKCTNYFEKYQFEKVKQEVDNFFWNIFCDNYLEIVKDRLYKPESYEKISKDSAQYTLYTTYKQLIKMIHPIMPFITETMWQNSLKKYEKQESIAISEWPKPLNIKINKDEEIAGKLTIDICTEIRRFKSKNNKSLNANVNIKINCDETTRKQTELILQDIISASKAQKTEFTKEKIRTDIKLFESIGKKSIEANEEKIPEKAEFLTLQIDFI